MAVGPIPVRLTKEQIARIDSAAKSMGTTRTGVIKICLLAFLQRFEREGLGMLPPDWDERLRDQDGRTHRYGPTGPGHRVRIANKVSGKAKVTQHNHFTSAPSVPAPAEPSKFKPSKRGRKKKPPAK